MNHRLLPLLIVLASSAAAFACPNCKDSIPQTGAEAAGNLPGGFNASIYTMLIGLFSVMGLVGTIIVKGIRGSHRAIHQPIPGK